MFSAKRAVFNGSKLNKLYDTEIYCKNKQGT